VLAGHLRRQATLVVRAEPQGKGNGSAGRVVLPSVASPHPSNPGKNRRAGCYWRPSAAWGNTTDARGRMPARRLRHGRFTASAGVRGVRP